MKLNAYIPANRFPSRKPAVSSAMGTGLPRFGQKSYRELIDYWGDHTVKRSSLFRGADTDRRDDRRWHRIAEMMQDAVAQNRTGQPLKMTLIGVADGQEPLSYLAIFNHLAHQSGKTWQQLMSLQTCDFQPRAEAGIDGVFEGWNSPPPYARDSVVVTRERMEILPALCRQLRLLYDGPQATWETSVQQYLPGLPDNSVDILSCINVLQVYVPEADYRHIASNIARVLKPGGVLITDELSFQEAEFKASGLRKVNTGFFRKD